MFRRDKENQNVRGHRTEGVVLYVKGEMHAIERGDIQDEKFQYVCGVKFTIISMRKSSR